MPISTTFNMPDYYTPSSLYDPAAPNPILLGGVGSSGGRGGYNINPSPSGYNDTFGGIPGPIDLPDPYGDLSKVLPGLGKMNQSMSDDILAQLGGKLTPGTINQLQDTGASWGATNGMPGFNPGSIGQHRSLRDLGLLAENQVKAGQAAYNTTIPTISKTQTVDPTLKTEIANRNALMASAPNPTSAANYAKSLFDQYMSRMRGPGGGTSGRMTTPSGDTSAGALGFGFGDFPRGAGTPSNGTRSNADIFDTMDNEFWNGTNVATDSGSGASPVDAGLGGYDGGNYGGAGYMPSWNNDEPIFGSGSSYDTGGEYDDYDAYDLGF